MHGNLIDDPIPDKFLMISDDIDDPIVEIMSEIGQLTNNYVSKKAFQSLPLSLTDHVTATC